MLESARLRFRPWSLHDLDDALALWGDARVMTYLSRSGALSRAEAMARIEHEVATQERYGYQYWQLRTREGEFVGCCGLTAGDDDGRAVVVMGYHLVPSSWGRGYATEATRAVVDHAFATLRLPDLFAGHHPDNAASQRVLGKLGFTLLGHRLYAPTGLQHPWYRLPAPTTPPARSHPDRESESGARPGR